MGKAIQRVRREMDMTQNALAERVGITDSALRSLERGEAEAGRGTLRRIDDGLTVELDDLIRLAAELAPGQGGKRWRSWSEKAERRWRKRTQ